MDLSKLDVTVTSGNVFTGEDSAKLALLIYRRFGDNSAWRSGAGPRMCGDEILAR